MEHHTWDESLETGDALVDEQHRNIHRLVDYVEAAGDRPEELMYVLEGLMEHVACHFATEEDLMQRSGYPVDEADEHVTEHRMLTGQAREVVLKFRAGEITSMKPIVEFLRGWLAEHVHDRDRRFVEFVRSRGNEVARLPEPWASNPPTSNGFAA